VTVANPTALNFQFKHRRGFLGSLKKAQRDPPGNAVPHLGKRRKFKIKNARGATNTAGIQDQRVRSGHNTDQQGKRPSSSAYIMTAAPSH
jgi:hypothetical protein